MKKRLISTLCVLALIVAYLLTALVTSVDVNSAGAISLDKGAGMTVYQNAAGGILNLPVPQTTSNEHNGVKATIKQTVPQKMMPGSVIIYDEHLQPKVIKGGYVEDDWVPLPNGESEILRSLEPVKITADMNPDERAKAEWENRLVNGLKAQILKNGIQPTQPYSPNIYPGMKVVYDENDGYISNIYYPDPKEPSGYSIHNVPSTIMDNDPIATTRTLTATFFRPIYTIDKGIALQKTTWLR